MEIHADIGLANDIKLIMIMRERELVSARLVKENMNDFIIQKFADLSNVVNDNFNYGIY